MAFTFNSTASDTAANSYVSVSDANDLFAGNYSSFDKWDALSDSEKQRLLVQATSYLNAWVYAGWKTSESQKLEWPRQYLIDRYGKTVPSTTVPKQMEEATCLMAEWFLTEEDRLLPDIATLQYDTFKAGPLDLQIRKGGRLMPIGIEDLISSIATGVLVSTTQSSPSVRFVR